MFNKKPLMIINNKGNAAMLMFPANLRYPDKRTLGKVTYYKTDRTRTTPDGEALIYVEKHSRLNMEDYATGYFDESENYESIPDTATKNTTSDDEKASGTNIEQKNTPENIEEAIRQLVDEIYDDVARYDITFPQSHKDKLLKNTLLRIESLEK